MNNKRAREAYRVRLVAVIDLRGASPHELRERFAQALRDAVQRACADDRINIGQAEELIRTIPASGQA
jgi:hypothetical protein